MPTVDVWKIRLDSEPQPFASPLSQEERERAAKFHFERDRKRYIVSHGAVRAILSRYTGAPAGSLEYRRGPHGKPFLAGSTVRFNLSHSGDLALCAVAFGQEVGVDVERVRQMPDFVAIARRFFFPGEAAELANLHGRELQIAFFRIWTRKEAWLKATGKGISGLGQPFTPPWTLASLDIEPGYAAALAVEGSAEIEMRDFSLFPE